MEQELKDKQSDLVASFEKLQKELDGLDKKEPSKRDKAISKIENHIDEIKEAISAFEYDILEQDLNNSSEYENYKREFEKQLADMKQIFKIKKDPNYLQKLQIKQEVSGAGPSESEKLILQGTLTQEQGINSLNNALRLVHQADNIADNIAADLEGQMNQLEKALLTVKDTRAEIKTANGYINYFVKELIKDKLWKWLLVLLIIVAIGVIIVKVCHLGSSGATPNDTLNGDD